MSAFGVPVSEKQEEFCQSKAFATGYCAGRGSGKSVVGCLKVLMTAKNKERWMAVSPTYRMIEDTTWPAFEEFARKSGVWVRGRESPTPIATFKTQDGGRANLVFRSADNPENLRGPSIPGIWFDEASLMHPDAFKIGIATLRYKGKMGKALLTFTPKGRKHWTFDLFYEAVPPEEVGWYKGLMEIQGRFYKPKPDTHLVRSHTLESPFLPPEYYETIKGHYTSTLAAQELAGEFIDLQGLIFRSEWLRQCDVSPRRATRVRYWDRAATPGAGKYTAGVLMARSDDGHYYIEDVVRGQWSAAERDRIIEQTAQRDAFKHDNQVLIYAEQEGGSAGKEISEQFIQRMSGFPVYRDVVSGNRRRIVDKMELPGEAKVVRAQPFAAQCEAGNVYTLRGPWLDELLIELSGFPEYAYSDQVDACSGAFAKLARHGTLDPGEVLRPEAQPAMAQFGLTLVQSRQRRKGL